MDTDRLRYFTVIGKTGSLTAASSLLHISTAALSKAMSALEREMGAKLFHPVGRGIALTEAGRQLLPQVESLLHSFANLKAGVSPSKGVKRCIRLGSFEVFSTYFLGRLFREQFDEHELELHELLPGEMEKAISERLVDLGITYLPIPASGLDYLQVSSVRMGVYGRLRSERTQDLAKVPFVVPIHPIQGTPTKVSGLDGWPDDKFPRYQKYKVTLMESALELCRQGKCVAYLPSFVVRIHNQQVKESFKLEELPIPRLAHLRQSVFVVKRKETEEDEVVKKIAQALRMINT